MFKGIANEEPILSASGITEAIRQVIGFLIVAEVIAWTEDVSIAFMNMISAVLTVGFTWWARRHSTPNVKVASIKPPRR